MVKRKNKEEIENDKIKFMMTGTTIIMTGTIFIYFLWAVINNRFLVNFSVDALVGTVALVFLAKNMVVKYRMIEKYTKASYYKIFDVVSLLLCLLVKIVLKIPFDFSLIILLLSYYISKKRFNKILG